MAAILVVDDERNIRTHLTTYLRSLGHEADEAAGAAEARAALGRRPYALVLSDVRMPDGDGLALLRAVRERGPETVVVLMTAYATVPQAVEAMRAGADDYLTKPFSLDQVEHVVRRALEIEALRRENRRLRRATGDEILLESASPAMQRALATARQAAGSDATVLLTGESGTGKSVLARQMHAWSPRAAAPFVVIACTTLSDNLLESELFGHVKGAFTGAWKDKPGRLEAAGSGTLFLDEVGELPLELQAKLLRVLEERAFERVGGTRTLSVDARLIAATNRDLEAEVREGRFREDLYFRLNVIAIRIPALRERAEDLPALVDLLLAGLAARRGREGLQLAPEARRLLLAHRWPGNVRELANALERAAVLARGDTIGPEDLPDRLLAPAAPAPATQGDTLDQLEQRHIQTVLAESATLEEAAARLGIDVTTLWRKRKRYGLP
jgi:NtrC-family two-component system response regulator AlgB